MRRELYAQIYGQRKRLAFFYGRCEAEGFLMHQKVTNSPKKKGNGLKCRHFLFAVGSWSDLRLILRTYHSTFMTMRIQG